MVISKPEVEFQYGIRYFLQSRRSYISVDCDVSSKFCLQIDGDILKTMTSPNPKPEVALRRRGRHLENR